MLRGLNCLVTDSSKQLSCFLAAKHVAATWWRGRRVIQQQHDKIFVKRVCGTDDMLLLRIKNLFAGRTICIRINNLISFVANLITGVIQGSVFGLVVFLSC